MIRLPELTSIRSRHYRLHLQVAHKFVGALGQAHGQAVAHLRTKLQGFTVGHVPAAFIPIEARIFPIAWTQLTRQEFWSGPEFFSRHKEIASV